MGARFEALLTSPRERAVQTATLAAQAWSERAGTEPGQVEVHGPLAGGFGARQALAELARLGADGWLLAVGHEPDLSNVVGELTGARIDLKKGEWRWCGSKARGRAAGAAASPRAGVDRGSRKS
jgi:phosphohistidine phosphatase